MESNFPHKAKVELKSFKHTTTHVLLHFEGIKKKYTEGKNILFDHPIRNGGKKRSEFLTYDKMKFDTVHILLFTNFVSICLKDSLIR